jgi:uncharacterized surface protein with fasciclin (FAS1) repeats
MTGLVDALRNSGLTSLADALGSFDNTTLTAIETALSKGNHTLFAPNNDAFGSLPTSNAAQVQQILSYHILNGVINTTDTSPDTFTIARTSLTGAPTVNLPGNQPQVVVLSETSDGRLVVVDAASNQNITSSANVTYQNLLIEVIPNVLTIPGNASSTIAGISDLSTLVSTTGTVDPNLPQLLDSAKGITIFAPINSAFSNNAQLGSVAPGDINKILLNHVINGTVAYSPQITNGMKLTTAGGGTLTLTTNSSGIFVAGANSTARVTTSNILISNGVIHEIDSILNDTTSNPSAASSAVESATSVQGTQTSVQSGPVTSPATGGSSEAYKIGGSVLALAVVGLGALLA